MNMPLRHALRQGTLGVWSLVAVVVLVLIAGGLVASCQSGSGSIDAGNGPGLIYFFADW